MSEEALRRALTEIAAMAGKTLLGDGRRYDEGANAAFEECAAIARAALSEGQAPEPVAQEPEDDDDRTLKPCPCCSGPAEIGRVPQTGNADEEPTENAGGMYAECVLCGLTTRLWFPLKDDPTRQITEAWNRRSATTDNAQEPDAYALMIGDKVIQYCETRAAAEERLDYRNSRWPDGAAARHIKPLYTHPAGMDVARAKAIEELPFTWSPFEDTFIIRDKKGSGLHAATFYERHLIRALATKGAGS